MIINQNIFDLRHISYLQLTQCASEPASNFAQNFPFSFEYLDISVTYLDLVSKNRLDITALVDWA